MKTKTAKEEKMDVKKDYDKIAILSLVLSVLSIFGLGFFAYIGFFMGIFSLKQIKYTRKNGRKLAIIAIVVGLIWGPVKNLIRALVVAGY